ncbi:hypothetical protein BDR06DRAFT_1008657 [Suillus hirtellus]|nr:hypothetical protein BDR06DRAFT_1008657 [Suillus hirtellus]
MAKGILETAAEVEERLITKRDEHLKLVHQTTRRRNKYIHRAKILEHIINLKKDNEDEDLPAWMWLQNDVENDIHCVLRVKNMAWHRKIKQELDVIDHQRVLDDDVFMPQGSKPMKRIRTPSNLMSERSPIIGLPKALYDGEWVDGLTGGQVERLNGSNDTFRWMKVAVA